jgi:DNA helicase-2/ATP-dependent DNA helicase PcrA
MWPDITRGALRRLDDAFSRLKLDIAVTAEEVGRDPEPGPIARAFLAYEQALADAGGLDFDDLVARALRLLEARPRLLGRWRESCAQLLVDETQDVDRSQLRLALLLAAPANNVFFVGDDDQTIYGWRLADVRRVLGLAGSLPDLTRIDLQVNYRCPAPVIDRAVRLVSRNQERFAKTILPGPAATGRLILAPDASDETDRIRHIFASWPDDGSTRAILARTNAELLPAAAVAVELGIPFRAARLRLLDEDPRIPAILDMLAKETARAGTGAATPPLVSELVDLIRRGALRPEPHETPTEPSRSRRDVEPDRVDADEPLPVETGDLLAALVGWAIPHASVAELADAVRQHRARVAELRREDALLTLATAHSTKGLEFDHVAVIGLDAGRFPSARSLRDSAEPERALEEERRLAYVAWTRARRSLTLVYDPASPSQFLLEAFSADELGLETAG